MTLANRILNALAALYAYAMAPDDYDHAARMEAIAEGGAGIRAATVLEWLEEWLQANPLSTLHAEYRPGANPDVRWHVTIGAPGGMDSCGPGFVEALSAIRSQVDDRNSDRDNASGGSQP